MSRDSVFAALRSAMGRGELDAAAKAECDARLAGHTPNLIPKRTALPQQAQVDLFMKMAEGVDCTIDRVTDMAAVPKAVADFLKNHNLPAKVALGPDAGITGMAWGNTAVETRIGPAEETDATSVTDAFAGIAETGTLMLHSDATHSTTLNFLPENHVVVLKASQISGSYEDAWTQLRTKTDAKMPRTVNLITGPSRTGDIEQTLFKGAHGPKRLHIVVVYDR